MVWEMTEMRKDDAEARNLMHRALCIYPRYYSNFATRGGSFWCYRHCFEPPCECSECVQQFLSQKVQEHQTTYSFALSDVEAQQKAGGFATEISRNLVYLRQQCQTNGDSIIKRWKKKSRNKREALLRDIDPNLYPHRWPLAHLNKAFQATLPSDYWISADITPSRYMREYRNACLLPYINLEGLIENPVMFLSLLQTRTQHSPEQWAPYDNFILDKHWDMGSLALDYNSHSIILAGSAYGTLTQWKSGEAHRWTSVGFPRAILILEAQAHLLSFLRSTVERILGSTIGYSMESQISSFDEISKCGSMTLNGRFDHIPGTASCYLDQPFSAPPIFDINSLLNIAKTREAVQGDHLRFLQTHPLYARRYIELAMTSNLGKELKNYDNFIIASSILLIQDMVMFWSWGWIVDEVEKLKNLQITLNESLDPLKPLSKAYDAALGSLEALLLDQIRRRSKYLGDLLPMYLREYKLTTISSNHGTFPAWQRRHTVSHPEFSKDRLDFCLALLLLDTSSDIKLEEVSPLTPAMIFAMLEEHLAKCHETKNFKELARLAETVYAVVSSLAAMYQMLEMVRLHCSRAKRREAEEVAKLELARGWRYIEKHLEDQYLLTNYNNVTGLPDEIIPMGESQSQRIRAEKLLADPTKIFMETPKPTGTRLSQQWVDNGEQQRKALSQIWVQVRARHEYTLRRLGFGQEDIDHDLAILSADSDPEYLASIEKRNAEIHTEIAARRAKKVAASENFIDQEQWGTEKPEKVGVPTRSKFKTKKLPDTEDEKNSVEILSELAATPATSAPLPSPRVLVRKSSYAIFQTMFPSRNFEERTKTVPWDSLVNAMAEAGFIASRERGGSAVQFEPDTSSPWFGQGKIVFHKPHPERVVDAVMLGVMGKRMEKWFGWSDETLAVGKK
ncbi:hypothetical protein BELL_0162g00170 [Botrytis elliptica]|uniref:Clr5 domain-containing protein n=1 Tax=Botrytis elliptica TaxID=278938 RepID=A0A4Z1JS63_9HELO|nr:hypothetical protein EAE99_002081 [Botrytis elliptica]TGO76326.1 hypothetical protein BELL_0162g00170 [Botrytis elliptica]